MLRIRFLGVGDGDSILIEFPDGQFGLIDSCYLPGTNQPAAWPWIKDKRLAFCCMTHPHRDHYEGFREILESKNTKVDEFWFALSDIDVTIPTINWAVYPSGANSATNWRKEHEAGGLIDLFRWVWENDSKVTPVEVRRNAYRKFGNCEILFFGPDPACWQVYKKKLVRQRNSGQPIRRSYENAISMVLLLKYGNKLIWLLGDILTRPMRNILLRQKKELPAETSSWGSLASIYKVSHHGAKNGWYDKATEEFTIRTETGYIIFSACGNNIHPHPEVWEYWKKTNHTMATTWQESEEDARIIERFDDYSDIAKPMRKKKPKNLVLSINQNGTIEIEDEPIL